ncbi:MBL fold metallo-hydrolase [Actinokineospora enzanensis]|uniref:MBL fold metallo-hydrolase n=1 Tax=Actinokineospora enzanensis TaxID=155975 RepID=UPI0003783ADF|nr:MBL fold metallo-hydrolase [Actinokineospora enzanensis]
MTANPHSPTATPSAEAPALTEVADGVHAFLQPDGGWCLNNAGVLTGRDDTVLIDTAATRGRAELLRAMIASTGAPPPRFLVNTHSHGDHTFGNAAFPEATVIAQEGTAADMVAHGLHLTTLWPDVEWGEIGVDAPTVTYRDRMTVRAGGTVAELLHLGPAHSAYDTAVWLPAERVLFAGDLVMSGVTPFVMTGSVRGLLDALETVRRLDPSVIVPGHGPVCGIEMLDANVRYLRWLSGLACEAVASGVGPLEVASSVSLGEFSEWVDGERLVPNLFRACAEARGAEPGAVLDVGEMFGAMVKHYGGLPTCHA